MFNLRVLALALVLAFLAMATSHAAGRTGTLAIGDAQPAAAPAPAPAAKAPAEWATRTVLFYTVRVHPSEAGELDAIAGVLSAFHADFLALSGMTEADFGTSAITVNLHPVGAPGAQLGYASMVGGAQEHGIGGKEADRRGYVGEVNMPGPAAHNGSVRSSTGHPMDRRYFDKLLIHEIAPVYLELYARAHGGAFHSGTPKWFEQGLEEYFAVFHSTTYWRMSGVEFYFRLAKQTGGVDTEFGLNLINDYNDGLLVNRFMADEFGEAALLKVLASGEPSFGKRLRGATGVEFEVFLKRLRAWLARKIE